MSITEKAKAHVKQNWKLYVGLAAGTVITTGVFVVLNRRDTVIGEANLVIQQTGFWNGVKNPVVVNLVENSTPSKPVHLVGTDLFFSSLNDAARKTGHSLSQISRQINGHIPDVKGDVFELLQPA